MSDEISVVVDSWGFGLARNNFGDILCGPLFYLNGACSGSVAFSGDLGNTSVDPAFSFSFKPGGTLEPGKCLLHSSSFGFFDAHFFVTGYAKPGTHTLTATLFACLFDPNDPFAPPKPSNQVLATATISINVLPDHHPKIDSVELTQAIQEWQPLADLKSDLQGTSEPPLPVIAGKPAVLRVYTGKTDDVVDVRVDVVGPLTVTKFASLQPQCTPEMQRRRTNGCQSVDFYLTPPEGPFRTTLTLFDTNGNTLETDDLPFESRKADKLVLKAVSVCDSKDAQGVWQCAPANALTGEIGVLTKLAPTSDVEVQVTGSIVRQDRATFQGQAAELNWFRAVVNDVNKLFGVFDLFLPSGVHNTYFGVTRPVDQAQVGGITYHIPSRAAAARTSAMRLGIETVNDVVAHETGHSLGGHHTNTDNPQAANAPPGCYAQAQDAGTDWPFPGDNRIKSITQLEVGFDVIARQPVIPDTTYDIMSYCIPRWISPFHYRQFMNSLGATASIPVPPSPLPGLAEYWLVSGVINNNSVELDPVFQIQTAQPINANSGTHRIEVRDSSGTVLFTRFFTPANSETETAGADFQGPPTFSELIPVTPGAAQIAVMDSSGAQIGGLALGSLNPVVQFVTPAPGAIVSGMQNISWSATNPNNRTLTTKVLYSPDNGSRWMQLDEVTGSNSSIINFDTVPGGIGSALLRLLVSDGINTGSVTSAAFTVSKKTQITAQILSPQMNAVYQKNDLVMLTGSAYNVDNGVLSGTAIRWDSNLDGFLGNGASLPVYTLQPGTHQITMTATDKDNNSVSQNLIIKVAGAGPVMNLDVRSLDSGPTTCVQVTANATAGSVELATLEYSLDAGASFTAVPLANNPFTFIVPGSGSFQLVARAFDSAGQLAVKGARFTTSAPCHRDSTPPTTTAVLTPQSNHNGWNNTDVNIALLSTDAGPAASGVKQIQYSLTGSQDASALVAGSSATLNIVTEGAAVISYSALDNAGNQEPTKTLTVRVDKTPPTISGSRSPLGNVNGWNNTSVTVSFGCSDGLSGLGAGSPPANTVLSAEAANQQVTGTCLDLAGNTASSTVSGINIDKTPPVLAAVLTPQPNANGWNNSDVTVSFSATDSLSGVAAVTSPVTIQSEGAGRLVMGNASDLAGNVTFLSASVNLDKTPPEVFNQFEPAHRDLVLFGRDALSGVIPGPITPISVMPLAREEKDDKGDADRRNVAELRTYEVRDLAGNSVTLKEKVRRSDHAISAQILSLQYNNGAVVVLPSNVQSFEWDLDKDGGLRKLEQQLAVRSEEKKHEENDQELTATFTAKPGNTTILQESEPEFRMTKPGLVLLRMVTIKGKLVVEF